MLPNNLTEKSAEDGPDKKMPPRPYRDSEAPELGAVNDSGEVP